MKKILVVDDIEMNRVILSEIFKEQYEVIEAADGQQACEILDSVDDISIMFLDYMMPVMNGIEVLAYMRKKNMLDTIPVVMITGEATVETDVEAYEYGAADIIYKPFSTKVVMRRAMNLIELFENREQTEMKLAERTEELRESHKELENTNEFLLDALGSVVEFRNLESNNHIQHVKKYTKIILNQIMSIHPEYNLTKEKINLMARASALHDVGMIAVPDEILTAPRKLTDAEYFEMKKHTQYGVEIIEKFKMKDTEFFKYCTDIAKWHHEKVDGRGYPDRLSGDQIPIYCQAVSLADCFDALTSKRVYKGAMNTVEAYNMIMAGECGEFSEVIKEAFDMAKLDMFIEAEKDESK